MVPLTASGKNFHQNLQVRSVTKIFNASFSSGLFPKLWKVSYVSPVPKTTPVTCDDDLRPISLTPCISKVQEDFAVKWLIEDVQSEIDPQQFGSLKGSSTTYCLLDMFENWLSLLDQPSQYLRICLLDFSKVFDHIDHNILVRKLLGLGVRRHLIPWLCSFLSSRRQAVQFFPNRMGVNSCRCPSRNEAWSDTICRYDQWPRTEIPFEGESLGIC